MGDTNFLALVNPSIALMFSLTFLVFWSRQRHRHYILAFAGSYFLLSAGFFNSYLVDFSQHLFRSVFSNGSYLIGTSLLMWGLCRRAKLPAPSVALTVLGVAGAIGALWYSVVEPKVVGRLYSVNFAVGGMFMITALRLRAQKSDIVVDRLIFWVILLTGLQFFLRTSISLYLDAGLTAATYRGSHYWAVLNLFVSLFSLLVALSIIAACAHDIMRQINEEADTDPLTKLPNRRAFDRQTAERFRRANQTRLPVSLIVMDIDHFKSINDRFGHRTGDVVLEGVGSLLLEMVRKQDVPARFGGEEFCVLLPGTDSTGATLFAEGMRTALALKKFEGLPADQNVTASFGVTERQSGQDFEEVYAAADRALYQAKNSGRNCTRSAAPYFTPSTPALSKSA